MIFKVSRLHQYSTGSTAHKTLAQATKGKVSDMEEKWLWERASLSFIFPLPNPCIIIGC
jgi:hypothetical protein